MRVTVSHNKSRQEAMRLVNETAEDLFRQMANGPIQIVEQQRSWNGSTMHFDVKARMAVFAATAVGTIEVTDREVIIDIDLPGILTKMVPEEKIRAGIQTHVRGFLT